MCGLQVTQATVGMQDMLLDGGPDLRDNHIYCSALQPVLLTRVVKMQ